MGISAIATYEPPWVLGNEWFDGTLSRKFVQHTGILSRRISLEDEVTMGIGARLRTSRVRRVAKCGTAWQWYLPARRSSTAILPAAILAKSKPQVRISGLLLGSLPIDWVFRRPACLASTGVAAATCAGDGNRRPLYRPIAEAPPGTVHPGGHSEPHEQDHRRPVAKQLPPFLAAQCSAACKATHRLGPSTRCRSTKRQSTPGPRTSIWRENVIVPKPDGGRAVEPRRLVFSLDMMGLGDSAAPSDGQCRGQGPPVDRHPAVRGAVCRSASGWCRCYPPDGNEVGGVGHRRRGHQRADAECWEH